MDLVLSIWKQWKQLKMPCIIYTMLNSMEGGSQLRRLAATGHAHQPLENILVLIVFAVPSVQEDHHPRQLMGMVIAEADILLILLLTAATAATGMAAADIPPREEEEEEEAGTLHTAITATGRPLETENATRHTEETDPPQEIDRHIMQERDHAPVREITRGRKTSCSHMPMWCVFLFLIDVSSR